MSPSTAELADALIRVGPFTVTSRPNSITLAMPSGETVEEVRLVGEAYEWDRHKIECPDPYELAMFILYTLRDVA